MPQGLSDLRDNEVGSDDKMIGSATHIMGAVVAAYPSMCARSLKGGTLPCNRRLTAHAVQRSQLLRISEGNPDRGDNRMAADDKMRGRRRTALTRSDHPEYRGKQLRSFSNVFLSIIFARCSMAMQHGSPLMKRRCGTNAARNGFCRTERLIMKSFRFTMARASRWRPLLHTSVIDRTTLEASRVGRGLLFLA
jgi:hypothetical protein